MSMTTILATAGHGLVLASRSESEEWTLELLLPGLPALYRALAKKISILRLVGVVLLLPIHVASGNVVLSNILTNIAAALQYAGLGGCEPRLPVACHAGLLIYVHVLAGG